MLRNKSLLAFSITLIAILLLSLVGCITINQPGQQPDNEESGAVTEQEANQENHPNQPTQANQPNQPPSPPPTQTTIANWTGTWQCGQIKMYLSQTGSQVTGWYDSLNGKIEGFATGTTLVGTWSDSSNSGDVQFTMSAHGTSSTGDYCFGSSGDWDAHWSCTRISTAQPPSPPPAQVTAINWTGTWDCGNWGKMYLIQTGSQVTGTYEYQNGKIEGFATGTTLVGTWSESPTYSPPDKAGDTQFTLSADGNSFTGYWRYGSSGNWTGTWNGTRMK